jgi:hypothetical protein
MARWRRGVALVGSFPTQESLRIFFRAGKKSHPHSLRGEASGEQKPVQSRLSNANNCSGNTRLIGITSTAAVRV